MKAINGSLKRNYKNRKGFKKRSSRQTVNGNENNERKIRKITQYENKQRQIKMAYFLPEIV